MSEFKFSCTSCGQHLAADEAWIGKQIQCPNCQATLTVLPPAPAAPPAMATPPPPAAVTPPPPKPVTPPPPKPKPVALPPTAAGAGLPPRIAAPPVATRPPAKSGNKALWIGLGCGAVCLLLAAAFAAVKILKVMEAKARPPAFRNIPSSPPPSVRQKRPSQSNATPKPSDPKITTDPLAAVIPDAPIAGTVRGVEFKLDEAVVTGTGFQLKQGKEFFPDASLNFFLFLKSGEKLEGRTITISPERQIRLRPHIHAARKEQKGGVPRTLVATDNYALRVEFGQRNGDKIPGRIYLEMGESFGTKIAGTFEARVTP